MKRDIDSIVLYFLPLVLLVGIIFISDFEIAVAFASVILMIFFYEFIISDYKEIWGFSGLIILSPASVILTVYTVLLAFPSIYYFSIYDGVGRYSFFISVLLFYVIFPLGLFISNKYFPIKTEKITNYLEKQYVRSSIDEAIYSILIILLGIVISIVCLYIYIVPKIPLFEMLTNPDAYMTLWILREESMKLLEISLVIKYFFSWARDLFFPIGVIGSLFLASVYNKKKYKILFVIFISLGVLYNSLTVAKAPTAALILSIVAFYFLKKNSLSLKFIISSIIFVLLFPATVYYFVTPPALRNFNWLFGLIFERIFLVPAQALIEYFKIFPTHFDYLFGRSTKILSWLHRDGIYNVANYVAKVWWQRPFTTGSANAIYIGTAWADFGYFGVCIWTFIIGFFTNFFSYKVYQISDYKKNIIYVISIASTIMSFTFTFISSPFSTILLTRGLLIVIFIFYFIEHFLIKIQRTTDAST